MRFRKLFLNWLAQLLRRRMKPERVQPPFMVPLTEQRLTTRQGRLSNAWEIVRGPVAIRGKFEFSSFQECVEFLAERVNPLAEELGFAPAVVIDDNTVVLTLGIDAPEVLSEGDFDFASALDRATQQKAGPATAKTEQKDS
ncbi:MAG: hypothetical protein GY719_03665 [bacterium]|nr:hypothetical protein [bacterium]